MTPSTSSFQRSAHVVALGNVSQMFGSYAMLDLAYVMDNAWNITERQLETILMCTSGVEGAAQRAVAPIRSGSYPEPAPITWELVYLVPEINHRTARHATSS